MDERRGGGRVVMYSCPVTVLSIMSRYEGDLIEWRHSKRTKTDSLHDYGRDAITCIIKETETETERDRERDRERD